MLKQQVGKFGFLAAVSGVLLFLAGCSSPTNSDSGTSNPAKSEKPTDLKVGIVFDSGGRGDKSFNDSAFAGIERAEKELGLSADQVKTVDSKSEKDYEGNLSQLAESGCNLIFAVGISQNNALTSVAPKYPAAKFAIIDAEVNHPNVRSIVFSEEQGSFLAGYLAGLVSKTGKVGFVGGKKIPLIEKFEVGYAAGAKAAKPSIEVLPAKYTDSWDDTGAGKAAAATLFSGGADIVYHAAGRCGLGVISAAKDANKFAIGVDSDQDNVAPGHVLTSMVKRVDESVFQTIKDVKDGSFQPGTKRYDLASNGIGLTDFSNTKSIIGATNLAKLSTISDRIKKGEIKVPTTAAELSAFKMPG